MKTELIINGIFVLLGIIIFAGITIRFMRNKFGIQKRVYAVIADKHSFERKDFYKSQAPKTRKEYIVTFVAENKEISFNVSQISYNNYRVGQKGILKYKGNKLIEFRQQRLGSPLPE